MSTPVNNFLNNLTLVGERLRAERDRLGLQQPDFAALGGAKRVSQSNYENGKSPLGIDYLLKLQAHGVDIGFVVTGVRADGDHLHGDDEHDWIKAFRALDLADRRLIQHIAHHLETRQSLATNLVPDYPPPASLDPPSTMLHSPRRDFVGKGQSDG